jgi:hypothetical protein
VDVVVNVDVGVEGNLILARWSTPPIDRVGAGANDSGFAELLGEALGTTTVHFAGIGTVVEHQGNAVTQAAHLISGLTRGSWGRSEWDLGANIPIKPFGSAFSWAIGDPHHDVQVGNSPTLML